MTQVTVANANEILKQYLKSHGITQKFVADKMGVNRQTFNAYVNGLIRFDADFALGVSEVLGISPSIFSKEKYRKSV